MSIFKHDEPWDTIDLDQGTLEIHEPDFPGYIVWKGKDGDVEYYKIKLDVDIQPGADIEEITDEREIKKIGRKVNKMMVWDQSDIYIKVQVVQKDSRTIDIILAEVQYTHDQQPIGIPHPRQEDILLRIRSWY